MALNPAQREHLARYLLDVSKLIAGIYVFTSLPDKPLQFALGCVSALCFLLSGLWLLKSSAS
ncbi:MAG TPA: hypothetical protein DDX89_01285 [Candidatus Omnitrophica bacterium]|nr:MAG: hypothetical protein A3B73_05540 [Omnitrophica WOR_2 bacterium RIFCSPHIGHO2_02_FULL_63_39]OGX45332.1 MAG: hypothetical protein A3I71_07425 [Omnitrophica WOR_2 bacterium RIFCSPLOWO2_02_FULL_63_16]OGX47221.1 MAG: hypothetical protein A3G88_07380 [Omnitrophica WOR_2 bacterium RIFCSPLOWO2_12_FULL_63_16]HBH96411.1 hypothetical protein [Candidatus Omnitrophota bacterium]